MTAPEDRDGATFVPGVDADRTIIAASFADAGWPVIAVGRDKRPLGGVRTGAQHVEAWLRTPGDVRAAVDAHDIEHGLDDHVSGPPGFAVVTRVPNGDGLALLALDVDGAEGERSLDAVLAEAGRDAVRWAQATYVTRTGRPDGGRHLLGTYRHDEITPPRSSGRPRLDLPGYVLLPGSAHPSGGWYGEITDHETNETALARRHRGAPEVFSPWIVVDEDAGTVAASWTGLLPMPPGLLTALGAPSRAEEEAAALDGLTVVELAGSNGHGTIDLDLGADGATPISAPASYARRSLDEAVAELATVGEGDRRNALNRQAFGVASLRAGLVAAGASDRQLGTLGDVEAVRQALLDAATARRPDGSPGLGQREAISTVRVAWRDGSATPRALSLLPDGVEIELDGTSAPPGAVSASAVSGSGSVQEEAGPDPETAADGVEGDAPERARTRWGAGWLLGRPPPGSATTPTFGRRSDGVPLLAPRTTNLLHAPKKVGKSFLALAWTADVAGAGRRVLWLDWEDTPRVLHDRLAAMGVDEAARDLVRVLAPGSDPLGTIGSRFGPGSPNGADADLAAVLDRDRPALVVVNSLGRLLGRHGLNPNGAEDIERVEPLLTETLPGCGAAVVVIDHQGHGSAERSAGSHRKGALVTGAELSIERGRRMGKGLRGWSTVRLVDERTGDLQRWTAGDSRLAVLTVDGTGADGRLVVSVDPAEGTPDATLGGDVLDIEVEQVIGDESYAARLLGTLAEADGPLSTSEAVRRTKGRHQQLLSALRTLEHEGRVRRIERGRGVLWTLPPGEQEPGR